jgi:hypothetical protein
MLIEAALSGMSKKKKKKDRGSYYGNLSGLFRHLVEGEIGRIFEKVKKST